MTLLRIIFLGVFMAGLVLAVFAMLHGVEHTRRDRTRAPSPFFNLPAVAAFAVGLGAAGYPLATRTDLPKWIIAVVATATGAVATAVMILVLARWALRKNLGPPEPEGHDIQGQLGIVSSEIALGGAGEITYDHLGRRLTTTARSLGDKVLPVGTEVVIDRIENGVALVEEWAVVELRL